jgi:hypothetical protein
VGWDWGIVRAAAFAVSPALQSRHLKREKIFKTNPFSLFFFCACTVFLLLATVSNEDQGGTQAVIVCTSSF